MQTIRSTKSKTVLAVATMATTLFTVGGMFASAAHADYAPSPYDYVAGHGDVVGVGSDTVQFIGNFLSDGDTAGHLGYNGNGGKFKMISLDATADANVRFSYALTSSVTAPQPLDPTVALRAGQFPAQRPNGSGAGYNALLADVTTTATEKINFVRGSSLPSQGNYDLAVSNGWGGLHVVRSATDTVQTVAVNAPNSNVPLGLSRAQLTALYGTPGVATWSALPGGYNPPNPAAPVGTTGNCPSCVPAPLLPQAGSGTRKTFLADISLPTGPFNAKVDQTIEENDPTAVTGNPTPADAFAPMSGGRLALWSSGYFHNPHTATSNNPYPGGAALVPGVSVLTGTPSDANPVYLDSRGLYLTFRNIDENDPTWQPGSAKNWVQDLFTAGGFLSTSFKAKSLVNASGATYAYLDCGNAGPSGWSAAGCVNVVQ